MATRLATSLSDNDGADSGRTLTPTPSGQVVNGESQADPNSQFPFLERAWSNSVVMLVALLPTTVLSTLLLIGTLLQWTIPGLYDFIVKYRAQVQVVIHLISALLSTAHTLVLCRIINLSTRIMLVQQSRSLDCLTFWASLSTNKPNPSLPKRYLAWVVLFHGITLAPAALWTGSLTPITVFEFKTNKNLSLTIPQYSDASLDYWLMQDWQNASAPLQNDFGTFSYAPSKNLQGLILTNAGSASTRDGSPQVHSKNDKSGFLYHDRSFGIAASVGLNSSPSSIESFQYQEDGYDTEIKCDYNTSTNYRLDLAQDSTDNAIPKVFTAHGDLPNGNQGGGYNLCSLGSSDDAFGVGFVPTGSDSFLQPAGTESFIGIAAGANYAPLNATQCTITLTPRRFDILVNNTQKTIKVTRNNSTGRDIEPRGWISYQSADALLLTAMTDATLWTSTYGNALMSNVNNVLAQPTGESNRTKTLRGVSEAFESMVDAYLLAFASAQLMIAEDTTNTSIRVRRNTVAIGQKGFIIGICVLNAIIVAAVILTSFLTKGWDGLPKWNYTDLKTVIISSSTGGIEIGNEASARHKNLKTVWVGDASDRVVGGLRTTLRIDEGLPLMLEKEEASN